MGFFEKIKQGLSKTASSISSVFTASELDDEFYDDLEESLILADLGMDTTVKAVERLRLLVPLDGERVGGADGHAALAVDAALLVHAHDVEVLVLVVRFVGALARAGAALDAAVGVALNQVGGQEVVDGHG